VHGRENEVAGLRRLERRLGGLLVTKLADQDHVGILAQHTPECLHEGLGVEPHLALGHDAAAVWVDDLDRVFDRDDVLPARSVDLVDHRREGRRFSRPGRAGDEDEAAGLVREPLHPGRETELLEGRHLVRDMAEGERDEPRWRNPLTRKRPTPSAMYAVSRSPEA